MWTASSGILSAMIFLALNFPPGYLSGDLVVSADADEDEDEDEDEVVWVMS